VPIKSPIPDAIFYVCKSGLPNALDADTTVAADLVKSCRNNISPDTSHARHPGP
jgi:hypothetical protein